MDSTPTVIGGIQSVFQFIGDLAVQWVPGAITSVTSPNTPNGISFQAAPEGAPATAQQTADYLQGMSAPDVYPQLSHDWGVFVAISLFACLLMASLIIYCIIRILQIRRHEHQKWAAASHPVASHDVPQAHLRWNAIKAEAYSESEQSWRLAILEADIMLNDLLDALGYKGETMADKMRQVDRANFRTIEMAWDAHRVRNSIAHEGGSSPISSHEVRRVISLYEQIFKEFRYVA